MLKLIKRYRSKYWGEDIVVDRNYTNNVWHDTTEHVPNSIINNQTSNRAVVLGNGLSRLQYNILAIKETLGGGPYGAEKPQTYGCNALYRDFTPDFLISAGDAITDEIAASGYTDNNIVYTHSIKTLQYPGKFYLIPYDPYTDAGATALYIAAFDGHKIIYMLGMDLHDGTNFNNNVYAGTDCYEDANTKYDDTRWIMERKVIFDVYNDVEFVWVSLHGNQRLPELWQSSLNLRQLSYYQFTVEADI
jgi:hypothetical protein